MSRRAWLSAGLLVLLVLGLLLVRRSPTPASTRAAATAPASPTSSPRQATTADHRDAPKATRGAAEASRVRSEAQQIERARRDAMRDRIRERLATRPAGGGAQGSGGGASDAPEAAGTDALTNRMGPGTEALAAAVNREFLPLAQECVDAAIEREPALRGTLAIQIDAIGDEEVGAVIDRVEFPPDNQLNQAELLECVRETSLSMALPAPAAGGEVGFMITMPVGAPQP